MQLNVIGKLPQHRKRQLEEVNFMNEVIPKGVSMYSIRAAQLKLLCKPPTTSIYTNLSKRTTPI